ncbi:MAG: DUF2905 domain-containing protein [Egibacteraceae bacterium]
MDRSLGPLLIALGVTAILVGLAASAGWLSWLGRLPGDLRFEGQGGRVYVPITSMIIVSVVLTVLANLFLRR